ncbi:MAG: hypothetical protein R3B82_20900 [Sandaracinaceae bacterium]
MVDKLFRVFPVLFGMVNDATGVRRCSSRGMMFSGGPMTKAARSIVLEYESRSVAVRVSRRPEFEEYGIHIEAIEDACIE